MQVLRKSSDLPRKNKDGKRVLHISDIHLLADNTPTEVIISNFWEMVTPELMATLDAMYINGDLFDKSNYLRTPAAIAAINFVRDLVKAAEIFGFGLRVLNGTPYHEQNQARMVEDFAEGCCVDVKYLSGIGIFRDPCLDMDVGWVEDEYNPNAKDTEKEFDELLKTKGISKVGMMAMHGVFTFQLPITADFTFTESFWLRRVIHGIYIGHDHHPKTYGKIRVTGSFDRLRFGEEEDKGFTIMDIVDGVAVNYFVVNTKAVPYTKVPYVEDYETNYQNVLAAMAEIEKHPNGEYGRIAVEYKPESDMSTHIRRWDKIYKFVVEGRKLEDEKEVAKLELAFKATELETLSNVNIVSKTLENMNVSKLTESDMAIANKLLSRVL